ncbi:MAG: HAD family phosphatase [Methylococcaceae bacterium]|nr:HAD family phosphatase [Methylococcaceae bacterium]
MTTLLPRFEGVILDMDGLALDTEPAYSDAWRKAAGDLGFELTPEACGVLAGHHADHVRREFQRMMGERFDPARFYPLAETYWRETVRRGIARMPGLDELLNQLEQRRIPRLLATNSDRRYALECLRYAGAERLIPGMVCRSDVARGKPEPDLVEAAARRLGLEPSLCLVLEDSAAGLIAARRAGAIPVLVNAKPARDRLISLARWYFNDLHEVVDWLRLRACPQPSKTAASLPAS